MVKWHPMHEKVHFFRQSIILAVAVNQFLFCFAFFFCILHDILELCKSTRCSLMIRRDFSFHTERSNNVHLTKSLESSAVFQNNLVLQPPRRPSHPVTQQTDVATYQSRECSELKMLFRFLLVYQFSDICPLKQSYPRFDWSRHFMQIDINR